MASAPLLQPLQGKLLVHQPNCYLICVSPQEGEAQAVLLLQSDPPTEPPDHDAVQRAWTYLTLEKNKHSGEPLTVTQGFWPYAPSMNALCVIDSQ